MIFLSHLTDFPPELNVDIISTTEIVTGKVNGEEGVWVSASVGEV